jgi:hypothetical protein
MERFSALIGFVLILAIAYALSNNKRAIRWRIVMWGLLLQIATAILVLKGEPISKAFGMPGTRPMAALIFVAITLIVYFVAKRLPENVRRFLWYGYSVVAAFLFLAYNLLAYLFENMKEVVNKLIAYTQEGSKFVFGSIGDPANKSVGFIFATQVLPTIIFIASIFAIREVLRPPHVAIHGRVRRGVHVGGRVDLHGPDRSAADDPAVSAGDDDVGADDDHDGRHGARVGRNHGRVRSRREGRCHPSIDCGDHDRTGRDHDVEDDRPGDGEAEDRR